MKTEFSQFCHDYAEVLKPLRGILQETVEGLRDKHELGALTNTRSGLADLHHRLRTLLDKVGEQQAFLIIFGPLKSGKSTLMNAVSSAYVSEVSSLPAYPCLVYVRHADDPKITVTKYNGKVDEIGDGSRMQEEIDRHHEELANQIREAEEKGEVFDPGTHFTDAIRRIDIGLEAEALKNSSTVLVDTPGLYSRMRFGYDLMTREFRDSAACAVFVVKTDNLFLEQVFNEFGDLLDLFSRIFLVVNIDGGKRDLGPDGKLHPSLESRDPAQIVEAFRSLSMSAPLRRAYDEGRLKIYPIDVLSAAASNLKGLNLDEEQEPEGEPEASSGPGSTWAGFKPGVLDSIRAVELPADPGSADPDTGQVVTGETFDSFLADLTDYLNSNEYLVNFTRDSLRQGKTLLAELNENVTADALVDFRKEIDTLKRDLASRRKQREAVVELEGVDWRSTFAGSKKICGTDGEQFAASQTKRMTSEVSGALNAWFKTDRSLDDLLSDHVRPGVEDCLKQVREDVLARAGRVTNGSRCGAELSASQAQQLATAGISLPDLQRSENIEPEGTGEEVSAGDLALPLNEIPVRKTFMDYILFRPASRVRAKVFGGAGKLNRPIPAKVKAARLGEAGKKALAEQLVTRIEETVPGEATRVSSKIFETYGGRFADAIGSRLGELKSQLDGEMPDLSKRIEEGEDILATIDRLGRKANEVEQGVEELEKEFAKEHPETIQETGVAESAMLEDDSETDDPEEGLFGDSADLFGDDDDEEGEHTGSPQASADAASADAAGPPKIGLGSPTPPPTPSWVKPLNKQAPLGNPSGNEPEA